MSDFRESLYTIDKQGRRKWVYPTLVKGFFFKRRAIISSLLVAIYIATPWLEIGDKQAVLLDIASRRFTFLGTTFWATDTRLLALTLGMLAFSLFFFTALFGRVWCGWACPETVFLEFLFRPIERFIEGDTAARKRLDAQPWTLNKLFKKGLKLLVYSFLAWVLASTTLAYFLGQDRLIQMMANPPSQNMGTFLLTLAMMGFLLFQFGWFREQFCTVICPYARFQSVLLDSHSLLVGYDKNRGEPRGKAVKGATAESRGDCIDCGLCVRVCPTGIDIRNGLQLECIQCASCADACDSIMVQIGRPKGLVRYDTEMGLAKKARQILRPRVFVYSAILALYAILFIITLSTRELSEFQAVRGPGELPFSILSTGEVSNKLYVHLSNKGETDNSYYIEVSEGLRIIAPLSPFPVPHGQNFRVPIFIEFPREKAKNGKLPVTITVKDGHGFVNSQKVTLFAPEV